MQLRNEDTGLSYLAPQALKRAAFVVLCTAVMMFGSAMNVRLAFADPTTTTLPPHWDTTQVGSAGTLVGASLETAGHLLQSRMLDLLDPAKPIANNVSLTVGALLYVIAAMTALFTIAVGGNYKFGLWFFAGPVLFFWIIRDRVDSNGASWISGSREHPFERVYRVTEWARADYNDMTTAGAAPRVSRVFAMWNHFTSEVVRSFVSVLDPGPTAANRFDDPEANFIVKGERLLFLEKMVPPTDPKLILFANLTAINGCREYYSLLSARYNPSYNAVRLEEYKNALDQARQSSQFYVTDELRQILQEAQTDPALFGAAAGASGSSPFVSLLSLAPNIIGKPIPNTGALMSCNDMWKLAAAFCKKNSNELIQKLVDYGMPEEYRSDPAKRAAYELNAKKKLISRFNYQPNDIGVSDPTAQPLDQVLNEEQMTLFLINEMAARMLIKGFANVNEALQQKSLIAHGPDMLDKQVQAEDDVSNSVQNVSQTEEYQHKGDFLTAMLAMPYIQGMVLFFLAWAFPFFAMALIVPGRHHTFILWMELWLWVKSWDLGFAVVMAVERILYAAMPRHALMPNEKLEDPDMVFQQLLKVDATYSVSTYYNLIAACLFAVPVITGFLVRKGGGDIVSAVVQGFHGFSGKIGGAMNAFESSLFANTVLGRVQMRSHDAVKNNAQRAMNDPVVKQGLKFSFLNKAISGNVESWAKEGNFDETWGKFGGELAKMAGDRQQRIAIARYKRNLTMAAYNATASHDSRKDAALAINNKWNSHDAVSNYPGDRIMDEISERIYLPTRGAVDSAVGSKLGQAGPGKGFGVFGEKD